MSDLSEAKSKTTASKPSTNNNTDDHSSPPPPPFNPTPLPAFIWTRHIVPFLLLDQETSNSHNNVVSLRATCRFFLHRAVSDETCRLFFDGGWTKAFAIIALP